MKKIAVFLSAYDIPERYRAPALEFAGLMARAGYCLVYGGTNRGLMDDVCSAVLREGGSVRGIIMQMLIHLKKEGIELEVVSTLYERKSRFLEIADAIVIMVGGIGTLDEFSEILELKKHGAHNKPIVVLNTGDFYEGLRIQLERMASEGFIPKLLDDLVYFVKTPKETIEFIGEALK